MNLEKMFKMQREIDEHIEREHPRKEGENRLAKKILALNVEIGEMANEWRRFKYWSNDQEPRTNVKVSCFWCSGKGKGYFAGHQYTGRKETCIRCGGTGVEETKNRLLEEFVDAEHFFISIAIELGVTPDEFYTCDCELQGETYDIFLEIMNGVSTIRFTKELKLKKQFLIAAHNVFVNLGTQRLGFTWNQIEEAYMLRNAINHQ